MTVIEKIQELKEQKIEKSIILVDSYTDQIVACQSCSYLIMIAKKRYWRKALVKEARDRGNDYLIVFKDSNNN